jgi:hypothetical protein
MGCGAMQSSRTWAVFSLLTLFSIKLHNFTSLKTATFTFTTVRGTLMIHQVQDGIQRLILLNRTSGLNKILVLPVNCKPTGRFLAVLWNFLWTCVAYFVSSNQNTVSILCTCESIGNIRGGVILYYSTTCIKLAMLCSIMTVQNVVYALCINLYNLSKLLSSFSNIM